MALILVMSGLACLAIAEVFRRQPTVTVLLDRYTNQLSDQAWASLRRRPLDESERATQERRIVVLRLALIGFFVLFGSVLTLGGIWQLVQ